jgi:DNA-binding Lrp family transcriptional regulator
MGVGRSGDDTGDMEKVMATYYGEDQVLAIILVRVDTKEVDSIAREVAKHENVEDVYLVTGDSDIFLKAKFRNYDHFKQFMVTTLSHIPYVKDSKTMMVVSTYKERGAFKED